MNFFSFLFLFFGSIHNQIETLIIDTIRLHLEEWLDRLVTAHRLDTELQSLCNHNSPNILPIKRHPPIICTRWAISTLEWAVSAILVGVLSHHLNLTDNRSEDLMVTLRKRRKDKLLPGEFSWKTLDFFLCSYRTN